MIFIMKNREPIIILIGLSMVGISIFIAVSIVSSDVVGEKDLSAPTLFEEMFDEIYDEIQILSGDSIYFSYDVQSSEHFLL